MTAPASVAEALVRLLKTVEATDSAHLSAATGAVANQLVASANMKNGTYTVANSGNMPTEGGRKVTVTHTQVGGVTDTLGIVTFAGTDLNGNAISEAVTPLSGTVATSTLIFAHVDTITGSGWTINTGNDTIVCGVAASTYLVDGDGVLTAVNINTTAAGTITLSDENGTIGVLASSIAAARYPYGVPFVGYLNVAQAAASDATYAFNAD